MAMRAVGGVLLTGILLGLVAVVPAAASPSANATPVDAARAPTAVAGSATSDAPFDSGPLVLLLVAGGVGSMGVLVREPVPDRRRARR